MNPGESTVNWLYHEQLRVDDEWAVRTPGGFKWWAHQHAQTIEVVGQETGPGGQVGYFVSVQTDVMRSLELTAPRLLVLNEMVMPTATMTGPVYDAETKTLRLASLVRVYDGITQWMNPLLSVAAILQLAEAARIGDVLAPVFEAENAISGPPGRGLRDEPDEMAQLEAGLVAPMGAEPPRWPPAEFREAVERYMRKPPSLEANYGKLGLTVEFPYGEQSSLCQIVGDQRHPRLGHGLLIVQSFPVAGKTEADGAALAMELNRLAFTKQPIGYGFGSYLYKPGLIHYNCFFPNALYKPGLIPNVYFSCAQRAREMSVRLVGRDWTTRSPSQSKSAMARLFDSLRGR